MTELRRRLLLVVAGNESPKGHVYNFTPVAVRIGPRLTSITTDLIADGPYISIAVTSFEVDTTTNLSKIKKGPLGFTIGGRVLVPYDSDPNDNLDYSPFDPGEQLIDDIIAAVDYDKNLGETCNLFTETGHTFQVDDELASCFVLIEFSADIAKAKGLSALKP